MKKKNHLDRKYIYILLFGLNKIREVQLKMKVFKTLACPVKASPAPFLNSGYLFYFIT